MSLAVELPTSEHVVLYDVPWDAYERVLEAFGDRRLRHSYAEGVFEIISPTKRPDQAKKLLARLVETAALELDIEIQSLGSTTLRRARRRRGIEPDECYFVQHAPQMLGRMDYDPEHDPPPDLAIEVDVTHSSVNRMEIYGAIGVREVWRLQNETLAFYKLQRSGEYRKVARSVAFPSITSKQLQELLNQRFRLSENKIVREFQRQLRNEAR